MNENILQDAQKEALVCDVMLVIGTSAQVVPASLLPVFARQKGAEVIEMNLDRTQLTDDIAHFSVLGSAGSTLPEVADLVLRDYI